LQFPNKKKKEKMHAIARHSRGVVTVKPRHCFMDLTYEAALPLLPMASARHRNRKPPASLLFIICLCLKDSKDTAKAIVFFAIWNGN